VCCVIVMFTCNQIKTQYCFFLTTVLMWDSIIDVHCVLCSVLYTHFNTIQVLCLTDSSLVYYCYNIQLDRSH
jgi:hypothetical protein